jgi:hypothetical protein
MHHPKTLTNGANVSCIHAYSRPCLAIYFAICRIIGQYVIVLNAYIPKSEADMMVMAIRRQLGREGDRVLTLWYPL